MTFTTPCARPENNPEDWFIERDGKQYPDDELITVEEGRAAIAAVPEEDRDEEGWSVRAVENLIDLRVAENLTRRRHAKDKCFTECIFRMHCFGLATDNVETHGTWGGYYSEERRKIEAARQEKIAQRAARREAVVIGE